MTKKRVRFFLVFLILSGLLITFSILWQRFNLPQTEHVILISIDTLRADHLGCYDSTRKISPEIDAFAEDCILFENTVAHVPLTLPSHCTMLSGTLALYHQVRDNGQAYR